jgi:hypothetical protein
MDQRDRPKQKELDYEHEYRNAHRENDKASRKAIPARKRDRARGERRLVNQQLSAEDLSDERLEAADTAVSVGARRLRYRWRKEPDVPLREWIGRKARRK